MILVWGIHCANCTDAIVHVCVHKKLTASVCSFSHTLIHTLHACTISPPPPTPHSFPNTPNTLSPPPYNKTQTMHMNTDMSSCDCFCWCCCVFCCLICFHDSMLYTASSSHVSAVLLIVPVGDKRKLFCMFLVLPTVLCSALPWHRYL